MPSSGGPNPSPPLLWTLNISRDLRDGVAVLAVAGRLGKASSGLFIESLDQELRAGRRRILLDLEQVDYISSAGLLALQTIAASVHESAGELVFCCLSEPVRLALDLAGLMSAFAIETTREGGLARLGARS